MAGQLFNTPTLHALVAEAEGRTLTLPELHAFVARLSDYCHAHGYPLAHAIVPAQTLQLGQVRIDIIEGHYGKITLDLFLVVGPPWRRVMSRTGKQG